MRSTFPITIVLLAAAVLSTNATAAPSTVTATRPWMDTALPPAQRAALLVKAMTLEEKISQIHMMDVRDHPREVAGVERLGIPPLKITNGPVGAGPGDSRGPQPATALPAAIGLAASFDPHLAEMYGALVGQEVAARGEYVLEGPGVNITRVPQNGRNFEYFGEDPYLAGRMGVAEIKAIQEQRVIAEVKHFAANNQETNRKTINEIVDERTLREIYLPAFEACVKEAKVAAIMAAYPSVNGQFCSENTHLLKDILRGEWGFEGFVQSDYTGTQSAARGAAAGLDLSMKADHYGAGMKDALAKNEVAEAAVDTMIVRRYTQMFRLGLLDDPPHPQLASPEERGKISRTIGSQCVVLLKNKDNALPLDAKSIKSIALIGPYAAAAHTGGSGSSAVRPLYTVNPPDGLQRRAGSAVKIEMNDGKDAAAAAAIAKGADVAIVMVGNKDGEGKDRPNIVLPEKQDALVAAVAAANPKTIVVLKTAGPVLMPWRDAVPAIVEAWYPGEEDGNVVADVLFGDVNPCGKLPMTFPITEAEVPANTPEQYPGVNGVATYSEKLEVGYRWYDAQKVTPMFPFGFGLSYTSFTLSDLVIAPTTTGNPAAVAVTVANTGPREGAQIVQVYVAAPASAGEPPKQLKGFAKVELKPGEKKTVTIPLDPRAFSIWDVKAGQWTVVPGQHEVLIGDSSRSLPLHTTVTIVAK